jgi:chorismate synthase
MAVLFDNRLQVVLFGESHGKAIGVTISGLPSGIEIDYALIEAKLAARKAKAAAFSTPRFEEDKFEILSGVYDGKTTGEPLCAVCHNKNIRSEDYAKVNEFYRPGHADYSAAMRYKGFCDPRGGGHFSGRLTAPMVFAGAIAQSALAKYGIEIYSHIFKIKHITDKSVSDAGESEMKSIYNNPLPVIDKTIVPLLEELFEEYRRDKDSLGGIVETVVKNVRAGIGGTHAQSLESRLSSAMFAIPAVKGIEFGLGFGFAESSGKRAKDEIGIKDNKIYTLANNNGGILGGIANGEDIVFKVVFKSVSSIASEQMSVNRQSGQEGVLKIEGRHDVCVVPRAVPVVESMTALTILDGYLEALGYDGY